MKIFIWGSYGNIEVYDISSQEQRDLLSETLSTIMYQRGYADVPKDPSFERIFKWCQANTNYDDAFEYLEIKETK